jgi:hypothetical protein
MMPRTIQDAGHNQRTSGLVPVSTEAPSPTMQPYRLNLAGLGKQPPPPGAPAPMMAGSRVEAASEEETNSTFMAKRGQGEMRGERPT